ncbi:MAG: 2-C-methyl-D-erythritol 2,4-cyclodiphosphate synthase [Planctomycetaceae bacterium]|jgi:2-C-methyl-D-erythritol 2,4-cyclodiphosphate synthase|nr:2-C-methyl-D-erythritol 2,4-cyclodiphosphate synthase [Planctomycetaceae bacterium]
MERELLRIGIGHDTHCFDVGAFIILGGVRIEYSRGLRGHSDADVLLHAVSDALLGAVGWGDIGELYPDTDTAIRGIDSAVLLDEICKKIYAANWQIVNIDTIIFAEKPKISPYKMSIKKRIAEILSIDESRVNVKAKTGERVGIIGREEAISAECVALLVQKEN